MRRPQPDADSLRHEPYEVVKHGDEFLVFEYPPDAIHYEILPHALIELGDVEFVAVACSFRVFFHVAAYVLHEVVHAAVLDAG